MLRIWSFYLVFLLQCIYTICRANPNVILLRLDFDEFNIAQPFTCGSSSTSVACTTSDGPRIGDCIYDSMTVTTPGSPVRPLALIDDVNPL